MTAPDDRSEFERLRRILRRLYAGRFALLIMYCRVRLLGLLVQPLAIGLKITRAITGKKARYDLNRLKHDAVVLHAGFEALAIESRSLPSDSSVNDRRQLLREKHSALLVEKSHLLVAAEVLRVPQSNLGIAAFQYRLHELQASLFRFSRKQDALLRILSQRDDSPTYYCDLLLWFVVPGSHSEDLAGDLMEEYQLRIGT